MNLTEVYESLEIRDREILVKIWNADRQTKLSVATLPFVNAWEMRTVLYNFYESIADDMTVMFPKGIALQELADKESHFKRVLHKATRT